MKQNIFRAILLGTIVMTVLTMLINLIFGHQHQLGYYLTSLPASLLLNVVVSLLIMNAQVNKRLLTFIIFIILFVIGHFNLLIEAYIFDVTDWNETIEELLRGFLVTALFSPIAVFIYHQNELLDTFKYEGRSAISWTWRIILGDILYLILYLVAGGILVTVYPQLMDFYADKVPPFDLMVKTQLLLRGLLFVAVAILILRTINATLFIRACLVGLTFSVVGGLAPLIPQSELMPVFVRIGHFFEVGISNFIFGYLLTYLIGQKRIIEGAVVDRAM